MCSNSLSSLNTTLGDSLSPKHQFFFGTYAISSVFSKTASIFAPTLDFPRVSHYQVLSEREVSCPVAVILSLLQSNNELLVEFSKRWSVRNVR